MKKLLIIFIGCMMMGFFIDTGPPCYATQTNGEEVKNNVMTFDVRIDDQQVVIGSMLLINEASLKEAESSLVVTQLSDAIAVENRSDFAKTIYTEKRTIKGYEGTVNAIIGEQGWEWPDVGCTYDNAEITNLVAVKENNKAMVNRVEFGSINQISTLLLVANQNLPENFIEKNMRADYGSMNKISMTNEITFCLLNKTWTV